MTDNKVLVLGASGVVGSAAITAFAAAGGWEIVGASRRKPPFVDDSSYQFVPIDLLDAEGVSAAIGSLTGVTHVVYSALYELPGLIAGWQDEEQIRINRTMLGNVLDALDASGQPVEHISLLQGTKAYGVHVKPMRVPARESQPRVEHRNFYWEQEDLAKAWTARTGAAYTIFRPQFVFGTPTGVAMNIVPIIGVYAAIRKEQGLPFSYPGGASYVGEAVDARLLAKALVWAATAENARNETFNFTNGDVFEWRDLWPSFAEYFGMEPAEDAPLQIATWLPEQEKIWSEIVERYGLRTTTIAEIIGESHHYADFAFAYGSDGRNNKPAFVSTVKLRAAGFTDVIDTEDMFRELFDELRAQRVLPPAS